MRKFNIKELSFIANALHVAAEVFDKDAETCSVVPRLQEQFKEQAKFARWLAEEIED